MCWPVRHDRSVTLAFSQCWSGHIWSRPSGPSEKGDCCHEAQKPLDLFEGKEVPHFEQGSVFFREHSGESQACIRAESNVAPKNEIRWLGSSSLLLLDQNPKLSK